MLAYLKLGANHLARAAPGGGEVNGDNARGDGGLVVVESFK